MAVYIQFNEIRTERERMAEPTAVRLAEYVEMSHNNLDQMPHAFIHVVKSMGLNGRLRGDVSQAAFRQLANAQDLGESVVANRGLIALPNTERPQHSSAISVDTMLVPSDQFALIAPRECAHANKGSIIYRDMNCRSEVGEHRVNLLSNLPSSEIIELMKQRGHKFINLSSPSYGG